MPTLYFIRHGEADWRLADETGLVGAQRDFVPLTEEGRKQADVASRDLRLRHAQLILSSPYTRALQTAAIINGKLGLPVVVEYDLREWIPDKAFRVASSEEIRELSHDYDRCGGVYPVGVLKPWEAKADLKSRVDQVLRKYSAYQCIVVVCHGMVIRSQVDIEEISPGEIVECDWPDRVLEPNGGNLQQERVRRAIQAAGRFRSGLHDVSANHDGYLAESADMASESCKHTKPNNPVEPTTLRQSER